MVFPGGNGSHTIDVTETTCFALLGVVKTTGPVDSHITLVTIQSRGTFHTTSSADSTELKKTVKDRAIVTDVVPALFFGEVVHIVWCHL